MHFLEKAHTRGYQKTASFARILAGLGTISLFSGDPVLAIRYLEDSIELWRELKNMREQAIVTNELALTYCMIRENERGLKIGKEGLELAQKAGDPGTINHCMGSIGQAMVCMKQVVELRPLAKKILVASKEFGQPLMLRLGNHFLADCDLMEGHFKEAEKNYSQALEEAFKSGNTLFICIELLGVAMSVSGQLRHAKAMRLAAASSELTAKSGYIDPEKLQLEFWAELVNTHLVEVRSGLGDELNRQYENEGKEMSISEAIEYALNTEI